MEWCRQAAAGEIEFGMDLDRRLQLRKQYCAKLAYDAVNLMMRVNGWPACAAARCGSACSVT
jgi:hypothetical protein